jgi:hypothetical protein
MRNFQYTKKLQAMLNLVSENAIFIPVEAHLISTDGLFHYLEAVTDSFGSQVDFAQLQKIYGRESSSNNAEKKYSPAECIGCKKHNVSGSPDPKHISTSYVERQNLTMRMRMRRFTRLTNAFSKKIENHCYAIALHFVYTIL